MNSLLVEMLSYVDHFLNGSLTRDSLESYVVSNLQRALDSGDSMLRHLANEVDAGSMEMQEGLITEAEFRLKLEATVYHTRTRRLRFGAASSPDALIDVAATSSSSVMLDKLRVTPVTDYRVHLEFGSLA